MNAKNLEINKNQVDAMKKSSQALGFACQSMYQTQYGEYGQDYLIDPQNVPTYGEYVDNINNFKKMERVLKNKLVAQKFAKSDVDVDSMTEIEREKYKFDRNVVVPKKFPFKCDEYNYPEHGLDNKNVLYRTANRDYGSKLPSDIEIPQRYYPRDCNYTKSFPGNYQFSGLNTAVTFSKTHKALDEF